MSDGEMRFFGWLIVAIVVLYWVAFLCGAVPSLG